MSHRCRVTRRDRLRRLDRMVARALDGDIDPDCLAATLAHIPEEDRVALIDQATRALAAAGDPRDPDRVRDILAALVPGLAAADIAAEEEEIARRCRRGGRR
jgi:hypothetical protein